MLNAILYVVENGCNERLPKQFGKWNRALSKVQTWARSGVLQNLVIICKKNESSAINIEIIALIPTSLIVRSERREQIKEQESLNRKKRGCW